MEVICIADTHGLHNRITIPECDILIHAGDSCNQGKKEELTSFLSWFSGQPATHKILIPGNHDRCLDPKFDHWTNASDFWREELFRQFPDIHYLNSETKEIAGLTIYGSGITPDFYPQSWAFNKPRGEEIMKVWEHIPMHCDIVITHGPCQGILDYIPGQAIPVGCADLKTVIEVTRPKFHICGHIHSGYGSLEKDGITYINAAICDNDYKPVNEPIMFEI